MLRIIGMVQNLGRPTVQAFKWFNYCIGLMRDKVAQLRGKMRFIFYRQNVKI